MRSGAPAAHKRISSNVSALMPAFKRNLKLDYVYYYDYAGYKYLTNCIPGCLDRERA